jgi:hypothetical protein
MSIAPGDLVRQKAVRYSVDQQSASFQQMCLDSLNYILADVDIKLGTNTTPLDTLDDSINATPTPNNATIIAINDVATLATLTEQLTSAVSFGTINLYDNDGNLLGAYQNYDQLVAAMVVTNVLQFVNASGSNQLSEALLRSLLSIGLDYYLQDLGLYTCKQPAEMEKKYKSQLSAYSVRYLQTRNLNAGLGNLHRTMMGMSCQPNVMGDYWPGGIKIYG